MSVRLPGYGWALAALLPLLAACGPSRNQFAPACPTPAILGDAADYSQYRSAGTAPAPHDLSNLVLQARISRIRGTCRPGEVLGQLVVMVSVGVDLTRGPAMIGRQVDVPLFIAVADGDRIIDKQSIMLRTVFQSNVDQISGTPGEVDLLLPVSPAKPGPNYTILAGFQLTPDQLEQNRGNQH